MEEILGMVELQQFCDTRLTCQDGEISAPRAVVTLAYPSLYNILMELEYTDSTMLILPQFRLSEVETRIISRISCGLKVNKNSISNNIILYDYHNNSIHT